jgi:hypothetical protein
MKTLWCKNQENPSDGKSHAWAPLNEISSDQLGNRIIVRGGAGVTPPVPTPFYKQASGQ